VKVTVKVPPLPADAGEEVVLAQWLVTAAQRVDIGQALVELELAKATTEIPSPVSGVVVELLCAADETVVPGKPLCIIEADKAGTG